MNTRILVLTVLAIGLSGQTAHTQNLLTITVTADQTKAKGSPWDGPPALANARIPVTTGNAAPDLAVCIVEPGKPVNCELRREGTKQSSKCQNAFKCQFDRVSVPTKPFGLVILDLDLQRHDLVDFAIVVPDSHPPQAEVEAVDIELHKQIEKLTPSLAESEHQRRQKDAQVLILDQCGNACRLIQSEIRIERTK